MKRRLFLFIVNLVFGVCWLAAPPGAHAQAGALGSTLTDATSITTGIGGPGQQDWGFGSGFGSSSAAKTTDGYTYVEFWDSVRSGKIGGYFNTRLTIGGFAADPGSAWLVSAVAGTVTFNGSSVHNYSYSNGQASWTWQTGPAFVTKPSPVQVSIVHGTYVADLNVKFKIMGVDYAPPGAKSFVNYAGSTVRGTDTMNTNTWTNSDMLTVQVKGGAGFLGLVHGSVTGTVSNTWSQEGGTSSEVIVTSTTTNTDQVLGPASSAAGVDHDYDVIWVWLNPMVTLARGPNTIVNTGFAWNDLDDAHEMEVVPLYVYWLKSPATIPADVAARLARSWDTGIGGLTSTDYQAILAADPFEVSSTYNPNTDATQRFDLQGNTTFNYEPPPPGGQPITQSLSISDVTTSKAGQEATNSTSTAFTIDIDTGGGFIGSVDLDIKNVSTYANTDKWNSTITSGSGQNAVMSITGPQTADNYTGPTTIQVWRDNVYGSFMFYPVE